MNSWTKINGEWAIRTQSGNTGDTVTVTSKAGKSSQIKLGKQLKPGFFAIASNAPVAEIKKIPTTISDAVVNGESHEYHKMWFEVDGKKFYHMGCSQYIWEGLSKSGKRTISFSCSVLHDTFFVCQQDENGEYIKHPHYCGFKGFDNAVKFVQLYWKCF